MAQPWLTVSPQHRPQNVRSKCSTGWLKEVINSQHTQCNSPAVKLHYHRRKGQSGLNSVVALVLLKQTKLMASQGVSLPGSDRLIFHFSKPGLADRYARRGD